MSDPKAKDAPSSPIKEEEHDAQRFLNLGDTLKLSFGEYTIKELSTFDMMAAMADGFAAFMEISDQLGNEGDSETDIMVLAGLVKSPEFKVQLCKIFALYCGEDDPTKFENLKIKDFKMLVQAIKVATDFDEVKSLFFELNLQKYLPTLSMANKES